uniref:Uncharacterized protein n=1 Tax=Nelumbo nucifera TaxID=4432 RepID=A0A822YSE2_NELNU|nr:TPA_asm: hypothetical protein HUJ06_012547 [Nelumbo nucifera]
MVHLEREKYSEKKTGKRVVDQGGCFINE